MVRGFVIRGWLYPLCFAVLLDQAKTRGCELGANYNATNARKQFTPGLVLSVAEQFTSFGTELFDDREVHRSKPDFLDNSITHWVLGYNFSPAWGLNLNILT